MIHLLYSFILLYSFQTACTEVIPNNLSSISSSSSIIIKSKKEDNVILHEKVEEKNKIIMDEDDDAGKKRREEEYNRRRTIPESLKMYVERFKKYWAQEKQKPIKDRDVSGTIFDPLFIIYSAYIIPPTIIIFFVLFTIFTKIKHGRIIIISPSPMPSIEEPLLISDIEEGNLSASTSSANSIIITYESEDISIRS